MNLLECGGCGSPLHWDSINAGRIMRCAACGGAFLIDAFPAAIREEPAEEDGELLVDPAESSCFHHPDKRAAQACESCGRFLCSLCAIDMLGQRFCASCLAARMESHDDERLVFAYKRYDIIVRLLAFVPILVWPLTLFTAPIAIVLGILFWKRARNPARHYRWGLLAAMFVAGVQVSLWGLMLIGIIVSIVES